MSSFVRFVETKFHRANLVMRDFDVIKEKFLGEKAMLTFHTMFAAILSLTR